MVPQETGGTADAIPDDVSVIREDSPPNSSTLGSVGLDVGADAMDRESMGEEVGQQSEDEAELERLAASSAREERLRLMPEYLENYFLEDLPPIDPEDPFNQGIYMRFRINQMRQAEGKQPVE